MSAVRHVAVAGGGVGGLALGIALRRRGIAATVVERAPAPVASGSGVVLAPNAVAALDALGGGAGARVRAAGSVAGARGTTGHASAFVTASGRRLSEVSFDGSEERWGAPVVSVLRARLVEVLHDEARAAGVEIRTGAAATGYRLVPGGAELLLDGRGSVRGDVVVGADGVRSAVRRQVLGDGEPAFRGIAAVRGTGPASAAHPHGCIAYGRGLVLFTSAIGGGRVYWVASIRSRAGVWPAKERAAAHADLLALLAGWDPELVAPVAAADPAELVLTDVTDRAPVTRWHDGPVVLLGDAAHPMVYTMGQGAGTALEDAVVLAHHLATAPDVETALRAYETERAPRTAKIQKQSRLLGRIGHVRGRLTVRLRDAGLARAGGGDPQDQNAEVFGWRPPDDPARPRGGVGARR